MKKANMILLHANTNAANALEEFLIAGGSLVAQTEPETQRWHALRQEGASGELAIFDVFADQAGRQAHFDGQVAAALSSKASEFVRGGWQGVLENVRNLVTLAIVDVQADAEAKKACYIALEAAPGKAAELEAFLTAGAGIVAQSEPGTLYWAALKSEDRVGHFAIFDLFADEQARDAHFAGKVAKALSEKAGEWVQGGWEQGVLANVTFFDVRSSVARTH